MRSPHIKLAGALVAVLLTVTACSSSTAAEEAALTDALVDAMVQDAADGLFVIELSANEADCAGRGLAANMGTERLNDLGVQAPDYDWPPPGGLTDETGAAMWDSISDCVTVEEGLQRLFRDVPQPERDCVVGGFIDEDIGLWDATVLIGGGSAADLEQRAQGVIDGCAPDASR